ncbi:MAG: Exonuclease VII small subunit [Haloquadratum sp. J07HQX50]|jgi:Exonuclease VII small subunit.|nr:MAG: Exonuclease VII small subunit [Haloquadratum sp. J07HQX50]
MTEHTSIHEKMNRVETIIERLESGDVSLEEAQALHQEGKELLEELSDTLALGDSEILEQ